MATTLSTRHLVPPTDALVSEMVYERLLSQPANALHQSGRVHTLPDDIHSGVENFEFLAIEPRSTDKSYDYVAQSAEGNSKALTNGLEAEENGQSEMFADDLNDYLHFLGLAPLTDKEQEYLTDGNTH